MDRYSSACIRAVADARLAFHPALTFIVGENGSGKSTPLVAIAVARGFNAEGGTRNFGFSTVPPHSTLHDVPRLGRSGRRARGGFFLRAESLYNVAGNIDALGGRSCRSVREACSVNSRETEHYS